MDIKIIVATHKEYRMPSDSMYLPLHVGAAISNTKLPYSGDDTGDNISCKNRNYCELTGLYWAWKNIDADYVGLVHYRRYFSKRKYIINKFDRILKKDDVEKLLMSSSVLLPSKRHYWIETTYSQYIHAHHKEDLDVTREIIDQNYHDYLETFDECMKKTNGHRFNMFIMDYDHFQIYCGWLFSILFELENKLDISSYSEYDSRVFGFVSERLLDVFIAYNKIYYMDIPYVFLGKQDFIRKGFRFIIRKFYKRNA